MALSLTFTDTRVDTAGAAATITYNAGGNPSCGAAAANRIVVIAIFGRVTSSSAVVSATIGGVSATHVSGAFVADPDGVMQADIWQAAVPTGTTCTVTVTWATSTVFETGISVWRLTGATSTATTANHASAGINGGSNLVLPTYTVPTGGASLNIYANRTTNNSGPEVTWTNATSDFNLIVNVSRDFGGAHVSSAGSVTVTATDPIGASGGGNECVATSAAWGPATITDRPINTTFYVSPSGSNSNNGTSTGTPWLDFTNVNDPTFQFSSGDSILFQGGQSFSGGIVVNSFSTANPPTSVNPVTFGSYGTGVATINSTTISGFHSLNVGGLVVENLIFIGSSGSPPAVNGVLIESTQTLPTTQLNYIQLLNLNVSFYGWDGIFVVADGTAPPSGFNNVTIQNCVAHDNTSVLGQLHTCGIEVTARTTGFGLGPTTPAHLNVLIDHCVAYNNGGNASATTWTGSGILIQETANVSGVPGIQYCEAYANGATYATPPSASEPVGIWTQDAQNIIIQFCESHDNVNTTSPVDGFDCDTNSVNCTIQYCYSHGNAGVGYLIQEAPEPGGGGNTNTTVRYCISQDDAVVASAYPYGISFAGNNGPAITGAAVYNNTVYVSGATAGAACIGFIFSTSTEVNSWTGHVCNNIFMYSGAYKFIGMSAIASANPTSMIFDGNNYYTAGTFSIFWDNTNYSSLSSWKGIYTANEVHSGAFSIQNPTLTSAGGGGTTHGYNPGLLGAYKLLPGSPMFGAGLNLSTTYSINPGNSDYYGDPIPLDGGSGFPVGADGAAPTGHNLPLLGAGMIGWRAALPLAAAWKLGKAIAKNGIITRRRLLLPK